MNLHPKYHEVADICEKYPLRARALFQTHLDLKYGQKLANVQIRLLSNLDIPVIIANDLQKCFGLLVFVPVYAAENLTIDMMAAIRDKAQVVGESVDSVHLAIVDNDSTVAYYTMGTFGDTVPMLK
ncbi:tRNA intron endonuclease [Kickxella alabastrina]|uniref:tRNA intron endonuclease n=1 Tax=Kickxella alabastrina TaxID=61397 RepID=UPI0022200A42|nr:tRNA intron endonuclease [Kickxella alabastrina]KAI7823722.1 tRNA intron endonuclease [Kickxella alabastrina]